MKCQHFSGDWAGISFLSILMRFYTGTVQGKYMDSSENI